MAVIGVSCSSRGVDSVGQAPQNNSLHNQDQLQQQVQAVFVAGLRQYG